MIANVIDDVSARFGNLCRVSGRLCLLGWLEYLSKTGLCLDSCFDPYDQRRLRCGLLLLCHDLFPGRGPGLGLDVAAPSTCCALASCHGCLETAISSGDHLRVCDGVLGLCRPRSVTSVWRLSGWSWAVILSVRLFVSHVLKEARP